MLLLAGNTRLYNFLNNTFRKKCFIDRGNPDISSSVDIWTEV